MSLHFLATPPLAPGACISLIGMAGVGKSTVGELLAEALEWACLDTDRLMEAYYGRPLQQIVDTLGRETFLLAEECVVAGLGAKRCVVSTGGSVVYGPRAVARLQSLGPVVYLSASLETVRQRLDNIRGRGLAIAPGQTIESLYQQRLPLYMQAAHLMLHTDDRTPMQCRNALLHWWRDAHNSTETTHA